MNCKYHLPATAFITLAWMTAARAQVAACPLSNGDCLQKTFEQACTGGPSAAAKCEDWLSALKQSPVAGEIRGKLLAGAAYVALADGSEDPQDRTDFQDRAREIYREVVAQDPTNIDAITGLATLAGSRAERVELLRRRLELDPNNIRSLEFLSSALSSDGSKGDIAEAAALTEEAYALQPAGGKKWQLAATAVSQYERAGMPAKAQDLRSRASTDFGLDEVSAELARPELLDGDRLRTQLTSVCTLPILYIIGAHPCLDAINKASEAAIAPRMSSVVPQLVAAVSVGMRSAAEFGGALGAVEPNWRSKFETTLEGFLIGGIATRETFGAYAVITPSREKRLQTMKAAVEKFPEDGELALGLGLAYLDVGDREEAIMNLSRARDLLPPASRPHIDNLIRGAH
jgi:tetratricopeptide (TPR) repeat protein